MVFVDMIIWSNISIHRHNLYIPAPSNRLCNKYDLHTNVHDILFWHTTWWFQCHSHCILTYNMVISMYSHVGKHLRDRITSLRGLLAHKPGWTPIPLYWSPCITLGGLVVIHMFVMGINFLFDVSTIFNWMLLLLCKICIIHVMLDWLIYLIMKYNVVIELS